MRVAIGGLYHESNTFASQPMTRERFAEGHLHTDAALIEHWRGTHSEIGGFLDGAARHAFRIVPTLMAWGMPAGIVTADAFEWLAGSLLDRLRSAGPLDGVLLSLHGAMVSERYPDADGEILARVRDVIGPSVPLIATFDFHANLTDEMVRWPDALIGYDTYPHVDQAARGLEAVDILHRMRDGELRPHMALARRPLLPHILRQCTDASPMRDIMALAYDEEARGGVVAVSVAAGFPYTDVADAGFAVLATADTACVAEAAAERVADAAWARRTGFVCALPDASTAVRDALRDPDGLTVLVDIGDNVGAGTPGDGTVLLGELLKQRARDALVLLCDPSAVEACAAAGVGATLDLVVGGATDRLHGDPIRVTGRVRTLSAGVYRNVGPMRDGLLEDQGRSAVFDTGGVCLVLTTRRAPMWNLEQLRSLGIEPTRLRTIVVKAAIAWRAAYLPIARRVIEVDTPGLSVADVRTLPYRHLHRPIFPLDPL